eukprot:TRINITY_DN101927_c0_g1_i1.p1 TRINITY_DN101927_c0_g1~~TRINITY_DN101927_c0_g1_i1.p1  ORF type:complete len:408 (+),score=72.43 TRINITY_DN101927_c0_g1_i1:115-1338(+)
MAGQRCGETTKVRKLRGRTASSANEGCCERTEKVFCCVLAVVVFSLHSWLQEHVSRQPGFSGPAFVVTETTGYAIGGLAVAAASEGWAGVVSCVDVSKYVALLPAAAALVLQNFSNYTSVRVFGAVRHFFLRQLSLVATAVLLYCLKGQQQSKRQWVLLLQLCIILVVLALTEQGGQSVHTESADEWWNGALALCMAVWGLAFYSVHLGSYTLRHGGEPVYELTHRMGLLQALLAFIVMYKQSAETGQLDIGVEPTGLNMFYLCLAMARGALNNVVLKKSGSLAFGFVNVAAVVGVNALKISMDGASTNTCSLLVQAALVITIALYLRSGKKSPVVSQQPATWDIERVCDGPFRRLCSAGEDRLGHTRSHVMMRGLSWHGDCPATPSMRKPATRLVLCSTSNVDSAV